MSADRWSRHRFCTVHEDAAGRSFFSPRPRFGYRDLADNAVHVVRDGETLHRLAGRYFRGLGPPAQSTGTPRGELLWWVIADFQPEPIHDPTLRLEPGRVLIIPSRRTVQEQVLSAERVRRAEDM